MQKILGQYQLYSVNTKRCLLCLNEKLQIAIYVENKRTEIISKCRHRNKYALTSYYDSMNWNMRCKVEVSWNFWNLWQSGLLTKTSSISKKFKSRCISCDVIARVVTPLFTWILFMEVKGIFAYLVLWRHLKKETIVVKWERAIERDSKVMNWKNTCK